RPWLCSARSIARVARTNFVPARRDSCLSRRGFVPHVESCASPALTWSRPAGTLAYPAVALFCTFDVLINVRQLRSTGVTWRQRINCERRNRRSSRDSCPDRSSSLSLRAEGRGIVLHVWCLLPRASTARLAWPRLRQIFKE